jgi:cytochrome c
MLTKIIAALTLALTVSSASAAGPTRNDATALVAKAAAHLKANGKDKTLAAINTPNGEFHKGELYVLAYDPRGVMVAHPINPKLIGLDLVDVPDADGKYFRREIAALAKAGKPGWIDYKYKNPETGKVEAKTTYVQPAGDVVLAAGIYKN